MYSVIYDMDRTGFKSLGGAIIFFMEKVLSESHTFVKLCYDDGVGIVEWSSSGEFGYWQT